MKRTLWLIDLLHGPRIRRQAQAQVMRVARAQTEASRTRAMTLLRQLAQEPGPHVELGDTEWGGSVRLPLDLVVQAHAITTGGTGSGKSMAAAILVDALLAPEVQDISFGVLDAKGELFERTLYLIGRRLETLPAAEARRLVERLVIVDLASPDPVTSYNIAASWRGSDLDFFAANRVETLQELLPSGDGLSLRGSSIVKHVLKLLAERGLPFSYADRVLSSEPFRARLLAASGDEELRYWVRQHFANEGKAAIAAVRARISAALFNSESLKLALAGETAPDLRRFQDEGRIVLINCAGPNIPRATARIFQALFLSDIRQAVFARKSRTPFLWVCDEAQNFFRTRQLRENMSELLTMSRSFGSFFLYLTQNLGTAVQDGEMLETLYTNIRWSLTLRSTPRDGAFLKDALPVTGRMPRPRVNPYAPVEFYKPAEERQLLLGGLAHLPDRTGWLWLKARTPEAVRIVTRNLPIPEGAAYRERVERIRGDARIGQRASREDYLSDVARRDSEWLTHDAPDDLSRLKEKYRFREEPGG